MILCLLTAQKTVLILHVCLLFSIDAAVLNNVAHTFGLMDTVKKVLDNRRNQVEQGEEQFLFTLTGVCNSPSYVRCGNTLASCHFLVDFYWN